MKMKDIEFYTVRYDVDVYGVDEDTCSEVSFSKSFDNDDEHPNCIDEVETFINFMHDKGFQVMVSEIRLAMNLSEFNDV